MDLADVQHMLVDVVAGRQASLDPDQADEMHSAIDAATAPPPPPPAAEPAPAAEVAP
jgi:hypothetical protein